MPPSIAIIGAGPAGLTLARLLESLTANKQLDLSVYDLDVSPQARAHQGGTLDLHSDAGLTALDKMGLMEEARPFLRYEGEELVIADKNGTQLVHMKEAVQIEGYDGRPEIDREKLKEILLRAVGETKVQWGKKLRQVEVTAERTLQFDDGTAAGPFDLVVGADGAWSKVRNVLTDVRPQYSGVCGFEGHIRQPSQAIDLLVGRGSYFAYSDGRGLTAQRMGDNSIRVGVWVKRPKEWVDEMAGEGSLEAATATATLRTKLCEEFKDWLDEMTDWIRASDQFRKWVLWELPVGTQWEHKPGFTLIGDAAHLCTPFAGLGVNAAMSDALELSQLIHTAVAGGRKPDEAVAEYEQGMFPRARKVQQDTMRNKTSMFGPSGPAGLIVAVLGAVAEEKGWPLDRGLLRFVPVARMAHFVFWVQASAGWLRRRFREMFSKRKGTASRQGTSNLDRKIL